MLGRRIGPYLVRCRIGAGGMGEVYEGVHTVTEGRVAVKVLLPEFSRDPAQQVRFVNEARSVNLIGHPGLVRVEDCGQLPDGRLYLVMEYLDGQSLEQRLTARGGRLPASVALPMIQQLGQALAAAHKHEIIHRDLKPSNVMIVADPIGPNGERVKIVDFGIAKVPAQNGTGPTQTGAVMGTAAYMSPEQARGESDITGKADVYALGVMFYELLAGELPFRANNNLALLYKHINKEPPSVLLRAPDAGEPVAKLVHRMLAKDAATRPSMVQVAEATQNLGTIAPARTRRAKAPGILLAGLVLAGLVLAGGLGVVLWKYPRDVVRPAVPKITPATPADSKSTPVPAHTPVPPPLLPTLGLPPGDVKASPGPATTPTAKPPHSERSNKPTRPGPGPAKQVPAKKPAPLSPSELRQLILNSGKRNSP